MQIVEGKVPLPLAAKILGISEPSVKGGMIAGTLPIGATWKNSEDNKNYTYHISPQKLAEHEGYTKSEILELIAEYKGGCII